MTYRISSTCLAIVTLACPIAALADATGTPTLQADTTFSFDTGNTVTSGGDITFTGSSITLVGSATAYSFGSAGAVEYNSLSQALLSELALAPGTYSQAAISGSTLAANEVFAVHTNGGNYAKVLITAVSSSSLMIQYDASGGSVSGGTPTPGISAVQNAGSYSPNIAQGSVFVVKGSNLSASGLTQFSFPLPTSSNNVQITFTPEFGGAATNAYLVYLYNESGVNQLAAILPSTVAAGPYNVTVTYNNAASSAFPVTVVPVQPGLITGDSTGNGLAVVQNYISASELDIDRFTVGSIAGFTISPGRPGQTMIAWATGLGGVSGGDNIASPGYDFTQNGVNVQVLVGATSITPFYAGRAPGLAGTDQIDFTLPANIQTGCTVPFQISVNGTLSQPAFIAIAPDAASNACVQPGYTAAQLQSFDNGATVEGGNFSLSNYTSNEASLGNVTTYTGAGSFTEFTGFELASIPAAFANSTGNCVVSQIPAAVPTAVGGGGIPLDAGTITLSGPGGSNITSQAFTELNNAYSLQIGQQGLPPADATGYGNGTLIAGTYTLSGMGGKDVGPFNASVTLGPPLNVTGGLPSVVNRSAGLTINWTGGNPSDIVDIYGSAVLISGSGAATTESGASFYCTTTAGQQTFTVSPSILTQLPAISAAGIANVTATGSLSVSSAVVPSSGDGIFSAPLTAGGSITNATFGGSAGSSNGSVAYQ